MKENTEQNLIEKAQQHEPTAIAELYQKYWRAARATAFGVTGNMDLAEDAASESFCIALDSLQDLKDTTRFAPWLRTIVLRTARRLLTSNSKAKINSIEAPSTDISLSPQQSLEQKELAVLIHEAVACLPEILREAMTLFYFEGYSLDDAAKFLDVPTGTLKRRLHEGRQQLREAAEKITEGAKPMNSNREQVLQQLREVIDKETNQEDLYQIMRKALGVKPVPMDLLRKAYKQIIAKHMKNAKPVTPERQQAARDMLAHVYRHSERLSNPEHPVAIANEKIRAALPDFTLWERDFSKIDVLNMTTQIADGKPEFYQAMLPPNFSEESSASYIGPIRAWLIYDEDGSVCTSYEMIRRKATGSALKNRIKQTSNLSDALWLLWKTVQPLELHSVEQLIRQLTDQLVPHARLQFSTYDEPRYRAGFKMQFEGNPVPAAIGGVINPWPGFSDKISVAGVMIYLEPWAAEITGQPVELETFSLPDFIKKH